jgi:NIMA (never in mitosis gene a)-related kinase 2
MFLAEFQLLATLKHPNIVEYFHRDHIKSDSMLHLYMEYCGNGDLSQVIKQCQQEGTLVPEHLVWSIFAQIVLALFRCHWGVDPPSVNDGDMVKPPIGKAQFTVLHRDLKPENGMLSWLPVQVG